MTDYPNTLDIGSIATGGTTGAPYTGRWVGVTTSGAPTSGTYAVADWVIDKNGQMYVCTVAGTPGTWVTPTDTKDSLTVGEGAFHRNLCTLTTLSSSSGQMRLSYFTARKSETSTQGRTISGSAGAGATPTLAKFGVYEISATGAGTLVAATPNDTSLFAGTFTPYTRSWAAPFNKVAGKRYAFAKLVVTSASMPTMTGGQVGSGAEFYQDPILTGVISGLTDLPASFVAGDVGSSSQRVYGVILP